MRRISYSNKTMDTNHHQNTSLKSIECFLKGEQGIELAIVFGSMVSGNYSMNSDVDIGIKKNIPLTHQDKIYLIEKIANITGRAVDLIDLSKVGEPLLGQIINGGKRILGADVDFAELALKHLYAQEDFVPYIERTLKERRQKWINS